MSIAIVPELITRIREAAHVVSLFFMMKLIAPKMSLAHSPDECYNFGRHLRRELAEEQL